jgi:rhomboid protease GluP
MNLFALLLLGPKLEVYLGKLKYLFIYLFAGCGSMAGVTYLAQNNFLKDQILVGASGCITGIIGASLGIYLKLWRQHKTENLKQSIRSVLFAIVLQTLFDLSTPEVSLSAHLLGSLSGFIIALLVKLPTSRSF